MNTKEKQFAILLKEKNKHYIYQPYSSIFGEFGYMPDFYVIGEGFYEVVGSRQAFSQNRRKIFKAKSLSRLKIVNPDGTLYNYRNENNPEAKTRRMINNHKVEESFRKVSDSFIYIDFDVTKFMADNFLEVIDLALLLQKTEMTVRNYIRSNRIRRTLYQTLRTKGYVLEPYLINKLEAKQ